MVPNTLTRTPSQYPVRDRAGYMFYSRLSRFCIATLFLLECHSLSIVYVTIKKGVFTTLAFRRGALNQASYCLLLNAWTW